ncbi:MAG: hypothetical protein CMQ20_04600 [Gammaproteobacteria bacterium]|jgi:hypothetical protein|nr:hypothetical protein [Gammaproteobacteria bacterium]
MDDSDSEESPVGEEQTHQYWHLLRDPIAFQFKLTLDALRDLLLSPISIVAALAGLIRRQDDPGKYFHDLLRLGHRSDRWINLFGKREPLEDDLPGMSSDTYVRKMGSVPVRGEMTL